MEFNTDKCHILRVTCKQNPIIHDYTLHGKVLETVDSAKYPGVTLTPDSQVESSRLKTLHTRRINHLASSEEI